MEADAGIREKIAQLERDRDRNIRQIEGLEARLTEFVGFSRENWAGLHERETTRDRAIERIDENCAATRVYVDAKAEAEATRTTEQKASIITAVGAVVAAFLGGIALLVSSGAIH